MFDRYPPQIWCWSASALVLAGVVSPVLVLQLLELESLSWTDIASSTELVASPLCLAAAVLVYFQYRLSQLPALGWLTLCLSAYGVQIVTGSAIHANAVDHLTSMGWTLVLDLGVATGLACITWLSRRCTLTVDPLAIGVLIGIAVSLVHLLLCAFAPAILPTATQLVTRPLLGALVLGFWVFAVVYGLRSTNLYPWLTKRVAVGVVLLITSRLASVLAPDESAVTATVVGTELLGGVMMLCATLAGLRYAIQQGEEQLQELGDRVATMENHELDDRLRLHEITNTLAGIATASSLINTHDSLPAQHRRHLVEMLDHESARLARLLETGSDTEAGARRLSDRDFGQNRVLDDPQVFELDSVVQPLVTAQEALGRQVRWTPSSLRVVAVEDAVAEAVNVLLDNARKHAPGATTTVTAREVGSHIELAVADDGPGLAPELGSRPFDRGERGPASSGRGLGLNVARTRLVECGGTLDVAATPVGTRFVVTLPRPGSAATREGYRSIGPSGGASSSAFPVARQEP